MRNPTQSIPNIDPKMPRSTTIFKLHTGRSVTRFAPHPLDPISILHDDAVHEARAHQGTACTRIVGGVVPEKASASWLAWTRSAQFCTLAAENIQAWRVFGLVVRGATARRVPFFLLAALPAPFAEGKRRSYSPAKREDNVAIVPT